MSRSKHQFRPGAIEAFETRIVPTVNSLPGIPFVPGGYVTPAPAPDLVMNGNFTVETDAAGHNTNIIDIPTVTNNDPNNAHYVTVAVYTAPGGGSLNGGTQAPGSNGSENLQSQSLLKQWTFLVPAGATNYTLPMTSFDAALFDLQGKDNPYGPSNHFTGDDEFQCDMFESPDSNGSSGYAPNKPSLDSLNGTLLGGNLFQFLDANPNGKNK